MLVIGTARLAFNFYLAVTDLRNSHYIINRAEQNVLSIDKNHIIKRMQHFKNYTSITLLYTTPFQVYNYKAVNNLHLTGRKFFKFLSKNTFLQSILHFTQSRTRKLTSVRHAVTSYRYKSV